MLETELKDFVQKVLEQKCETNYLKIKSAKEDDRALSCISDVGY